MTERNVSYPLSLVFPLGGFWASAPFAHWITRPWLYIVLHTMVPCDTLTPRALRVTAHAICQWVLVRFELAILGSQAERSNHYTSVAAYILQCSFFPCVLVVLSITPLARGVLLIAPLWGFFLSKNPSTSSRVFSRVLSQPPQVFFSQCMSLKPFLKRIK